MDKKGAIEFSMTTIMVVIIGVAVLALGLTWIRGTFSQVGGITDEAFEQARAQISTRATADNPLVVSNSNIKLKQGEQIVLAVGYLNSVSPPAAIQATLDVTGIVNSDITKDTGSKTIQSGEVWDWRVILKAKTTASGSEVGEIKVTVGGVAKAVPISIIYQ
ncbi:MAG: hypothetical protein KKG75_03340 [Nanoarchaeota archaeon]|nr:hypothetical protein [Nanoarchaeota archaeon]